jgi:hypothetical protein
MKNTLLSLAIVVTALAFHACLDDKGNYDYTPVNKISIASIPRMDATMGDTLRYMPRFTFADPSDTTGFEFWWEYKGPGGFLDHHEKICDGRELRFLPRVLGDQLIQLVTRETRSGNIVTANATITGGSIYTRGWLVLRREGDASKLSYIRPDRTVPGNNSSARVYTPYVDLYARLYPEDPLGTGPVAVRQALSRGVESAVYLLQEDETTCLNGVSYKKDLLIHHEFIGGAPANLVPADYCHSNFSSLLLDASGNAYYREIYTGGYDFYAYSFASFPMTFRGGPLRIERLVPAMAEHSFFFAVYDKDNRRFLWIYSGGTPLAGTVSLANPVTLPGEFLDYNDTGDAKILYTAFYKEGSYDWMRGLAWNITVYERGGNIHVQRCRGIAPQYVSTLPAEQEVGELQYNPFPAGFPVDESTAFYQLKTRDYLFFATGNSLCWYDLLTASARQYLLLDAGDRVVKMASNPQESELGLVTASGKFITLDIRNERLMLDDNKLYELQLPGTGVDLLYKFPNLNAYTGRTSSGNWD